MNLSIINVAVKQVLVPADLQTQYIKFLTELNRMLLDRFCEFYCGLQLYQDASAANTFFVLTTYREVPYLEDKVAVLRAVVNEAYQETFHGRVTSVVLMGYPDDMRILPPPFCQCD